MPDAIQTQGLELIYDSGASANLNPSSLQNGTGIETWKSSLISTGRYSFLVNVVTIEAVAGGTLGINAYARFTDPNGTPLASTNTPVVQIGVANFQSPGTTPSTKMLTMGPANSGSQVVIATYWNQMGIPPFYDVMIWNTGTATSITGRVRVYGRP